MMRQTGQALNVADQYKSERTEQKIFTAFFLLAIVTACKGLFGPYIAGCRILRTRTPISWWIFALAGGLALLIVFLTISFQAIKAAITNPATSLRSE